MKLPCWLFCTAALTVVAGCSADSDLVVDGGGTITPTISVDTGIVEATDSRSSVKSQLTPADFSLTLVSASGAINRSWDKATDFPTSELWPIGEYTLAARYGDINNEGFDAPCYAGQAQVAVTEGGVATPAITCTLSNSMLSVNISEAFRGFFTAYAVKVVTSLDHNFEYRNDEAAPLYVKPGTLSLVIDVTKPNGAHASFTPSTPIVAEARHHYRVNLDVNSGEMGQATLVVSFDNTVTTEDVVIDLSDELMNSPAPEIFAVGFDSNETFLIQHEDVSDKIEMLVEARAGLSSLILKVDAPALVAKGFPAECNLMRLTPDQKATIQQYGLECEGVWNKADRFAVVKFTKLLGNIT
ncbi:MAG: DUF4493 domain-containing protein, partial [Muribaculaceae bacterium]|nr:DUF4493 domain-containing protein [Muribaculaceae bacterium]